MCTGSVAGQLAGKLKRPCFLALSDTRDTQALSPQGGGAVIRFRLGGRTSPSCLCKAVLLGVDGK